MKSIAVSLCALFICALCLTVSTPSYAGTCGNVTLDLQCPSGYVLKGIDSNGNKNCVSGFDGCRVCVKRNVRGSCKKTERRCSGSGRGRTCSDVCIEYNYSVKTECGAKSQRGGGPYYTRFLDDVVSIGVQCFHK